MKFIYGAVVVLMLVSVGLGAATPVLADHATGFKWDLSRKGTLKNPLQIGDNLSDTGLKSALLGAGASWNKSMVKNQVVTGSSNAACDPVEGRIEVCEGDYGDTGWIGLTQLWLNPTASEPIITQSTVKMNDFYFQLVNFNTKSWKTYVACHELGHAYGLNHQDDDQGNANLGTCLDVTSDPDGSVFGQLSNLTPNQHDYDAIKRVYTAKRNPKMMSDEPSNSNGVSKSWGKPTEFDTKGRGVTFEKKNDNGSAVITHVHWK